MQKSSNNPAQQQNISINISYNLNTHKVQKSTQPQKKTSSKNKKVLPSTGFQGIGNDFFSNVALNGMNEGKKQLKKQNIIKKSNQSSLQNKQSKSLQSQKLSLKKKKPISISKQPLTLTQSNQDSTPITITQYYNPLAQNTKHFLKKNIQSPDIFKVTNDRKLKTQESVYQTVGEGMTNLGKKKKGMINPRQKQTGLLGKNVKLSNFIRQTVGCNLIAAKLPSSLKTMPRKSLSNTKTPKNKSKQISLKQKQKRLQTQQNQILTMNQQLPGRHNKSCMFYSTKKSTINNIITEPNLLQTAENLMSQYVSVNSTKGKKRAQSAYMFERKDNQLVSKLLNMSVISSELGSSQLISSERVQSGRNGLTRKRLGLKVDELDQVYGDFQSGLKKAPTQNRDRKNDDQIIKKDNNNHPGNALRQYLNSIDLRVIKNFETDTVNISAKSYQSEDKTNKLIRFNQHQEKVAKTQIISFSQKTDPINNPPQPNFSQSDIITFYDKLFSNALQNKLHQQQQRYMESAGSVQNKNHAFQQDDLTKIRKESFVINEFEQNISRDRDSRNSLDETEYGKGPDQYEQIAKQGQKKERAIKLNFRHYKQLLNNQAERQNKQKDITSNFDFTIIQCQNLHNTHQLPKIQKSILQIQSLQSQQSNLIQLLEQFPTSSPLSYLKQERIVKCNLKTMFGNNKMLNAQNCGFDQNQQDQYQGSPKSQNQLNSGQVKLNQKFVTGGLTIPQQHKPLSPHVKSPKQSNRQKISHTEPQYSQICWQYNAQQLEEQVKKSNFQIDQKYEKKYARNINNSPNICSEDGIGSGDEEYDSKKYSSTEEYGQYDNLVEALDGQKQMRYGKKQMKDIQKQIRNGVRSIRDDQKQMKGQKFMRDGFRYIEEGQEYNRDKLLVEQKGYDGNSSSEGLSQEEQISYEEREINCSERWVNPNFGAREHNNKMQEDIKFYPKQQDRRQERLKDVKTDLRIQDNHANKTKLSDNYLECSLQQFGVKNGSKEKLNNTNNSIQININQTIQANTSGNQHRLQSPIQNNFIQLTQIKTQPDPQQPIRLQMTINKLQTDQQITLPSNKQASNQLVVLSSNIQKSGQTGSLFSSIQKADSFSQIQRKRLSNIVEDLILELIRQFAREISYILKKSSHQKRTQQQFDENTSPFRSYKQSDESEILSPFSRGEEELFEMADRGQDQRNRRKEQLTKKSQLVGRCFGIDTSFGSVQGYLKEFKQYLMRDEVMKQAIIKNINKDIGPNSLQILSYLRPQYEGISSQMNEFNQQPQNPNQQQPCEDEEDGLFVVPSEAFSEFQNFLQNQLDQHNKLLEPQRQIILSQKQKRNNNFWHRGIYESWNQFLDYERPYGINGKPYEWIQEKKKFRQVQIQSIQYKLQKAIEKLLQTISLPSGIIYDKYDQTPIYSDLTQQQKIYLNEQRLSRMLAIQLFQSEQTWINYNDQMAELLVELSRVIEERIFFQIGTQIKKIYRNKKIINNPNHHENIQPNDKILCIKQNPNPNIHQNTNDMPDVQYLTSDPIHTQLQ